MSSGDDAADHKAMLIRTGLCKCYVCHTYIDPDPDDQWRLVNGRPRHTDCGG